MVNIDDPKYKAMNKVDRDEFLDRLKAKADSKLEDRDFLKDIIDSYKVKLAVERAKD